MQDSVSRQTTQRRVILIRHAKALEEDAGGDHARKLSARGQADAAALAAWLRQHHPVPQLALCSTAARTRETLAALGGNIPTILSDALYLASAREMLNQIQATEDAITTLVMIGHNPGIHALVAALVGDYADEADADQLLLKFPTSACAVLRFDLAHWREMTEQSARLESLRY